MKSLVAFALIIFAAPANSAITTYTDEPSYLTALNALGYSVISEGFEGNATWAASRRTTIFDLSSAPSVVSQGLLWQSNLTGNGLVTDKFSAHHDGFYRLYSDPHGKTFSAAAAAGCDSLALAGPFPSDSACWQNDGWTITAQDGAILYGVGGWLYSNSGSAKASFLLDGKDVYGNARNLGNANRDGTPITLTGDFFAVIDTAGFSVAEVREMAGKGSERQFLFGDGFSVGTSGVAVVPVPAGCLVPECWHWFRC